jgi:hypothetical protein
MRDFLHLQGLVERFISGERQTDIVRQSCFPVAAHLQQGCSTFADPKRSVCKKGFYPALDLGRFSIESMPIEGAKVG